MSQVARAALALRDAGLSIIPIAKTKRPAYWLLPEETDADGNVVINERTGRPKRIWEPFQLRIADKATVRRWFHEDGLNVAIIGGRVSGNLNILDFDIDAATVYPTWREQIGEISDSLTVVETGKGIHVYFRSECEPVGNEKLARRQDNGKTLVLIETKGEGGYAITAPSWHYGKGKHYRAIQGSLLSLPVLTAEQVNTLLQAACSFDEMPEVDVGRPTVDAQNIEVAGDYDEAQAKAYAAGALRDISNRLGGMTRGNRNNELNRDAFWLGRYVAAGLLDESDVVAELKTACQRNRLIHDDGKHAFYATLDSGLGDGMNHPMTDDEIRERLNEGPDLDVVDPPLTARQKAQVRAIYDVAVDRIIERRWQRYHEALNGRREIWQQHVPDVAISSFRLGWRDRTVNEETGEIFPGALTVPFRNLEDEIVNIEYRIPGGEYSYEVEDAPHLFLSDPDPTTPNSSTNTALIVPDSVDAITTYLHQGATELAGNRPMVFGLPHKPLAPETLTILDDVEYVYVLLGRGDDVRGKNMQLLKDRARFVRLPMPVRDIMPLLQGNDFRRFIRQSERWA